MKVYLTTIAKNEFLYIKEFVSHHLNLGFDEIIIYDNNSKDGETYDKLLEKEISTEKVKIIDVRGLSSQQNKVYEDSYRTHNNEDGWMFFLDVDEFLILNDATNVKEYLSRDCFNQFNLIFFNWLTMSDSDLVKNDKRPLLERFTQPITKMDCPDLFGCTMNRHVKCGVRLKQDIYPKCNCPHYISNISPACDPNGNSLLISPFNYHPDYSVAYIKHFHFKTIEEFCTNKMLKGFADFNRKNSNPFLDFFEKNEMTVEKTKWLIDYIYKLLNKIYI